MNKSFNFAKYHSLVNGLMIRIKSNLVRLCVFAAFSFAAHSASAANWSVINMTSGSSAGTVKIWLSAQATQSSSLLSTGKNATVGPNSNYTFTHTAYAAEFQVNNVGSTPICAQVDDASDYEFECVKIDAGGFNDMWMGGAGSTLLIKPYVPPSCPAQTLRWGSGNFCSAHADESDIGTALNLSNISNGATGQASATCSGSGTWTVSDGGCFASMQAPLTFSATDGVSSTSINLSWGATSGASAYRIQYRKQGTTSWLNLIPAVTTSALTYSWATVPDDGIYEFQVRAENNLGTSPWSSTETGYIKPFVGPQFISQTGIPAKLGVNQSFTFSQVWKNIGSETWTSAAYGTGSFSTNGAISWGIPFTAFAGTTGNNAQVTTTLTGTAPSSAGTYTLQRIMQKSGSNFGTASTSASIVVYDTPKCSAVNTDISTTFNPNATVTATLAGASSVEAASLRVWGDIQGEGNGIAYPMTFNGSNWIATFPLAAHLQPNEVKINLKASVSNSVFSASECATSAVTYQNLPIPVVSLAATMGSFGDATRQGFVVNRAGGDFAKVTVDLGAYSGSLKARVEVLDESNASLAVVLNAVTPNAPVTMQMSSSTLGANANAWQMVNATVRVTYADATAATQGRVVLVPISWTVAPGGLIVSASGAVSSTPTVNAALGPTTGVFSTASFGTFVGSLRLASDQSPVGQSKEIGDSGTWSVAGLDYGVLHSAQLVAVARSVPPIGVTLFTPLEFASAAFVLPVQSPLSVVATDGTRENDVQVTWPAIATGSTIRYRVFRDATEITPSSGITALEVVDVPPVRGTTYSYSVKTLINNVMSQADVSDTGFVPACRAARLIGASMDASMSAINGLVESWECLLGLAGVGRIDALEASEILLAGQNPKYRRFTFPLPAGLVDGAHVMRATLDSAGVVINASRTYEIPFVVDRAAITVNNLSILYDGSPAQSGLEASSIGRFGVKMDGGSGIGFAEELK